MRAPCRDLELAAPGGSCKSLLSEKGSARGMWGSPWGTPEPLPTQSEAWGAAAVQERSVPWLRGAESAWVKTSKHQTFRCVG